MQRRNWPALLAAGGSILSLLIAVWPGAMFEAGVQRAIRNEGWWFLAHLLAGSLGVLAILIVYRFTVVSRFLLAIAAVVLISLLFTEAFNALLIITVILPAALLAVSAPLITPADTAARY